MELHQHASPNFNHRPANTHISTIIIHATGGSLAGALAWMTNPVSKVSCHYLIGKNGVVYQLVEDGHRAWHAGTSVWDHRNNVNDFSLGIELEHVGDEEYTLSQIESLVELVNLKRAQYGIHYDDIIGHNQIAPGRKTDPGIHFPWVRFGAMLNRITGGPGNE